MAETDEKDDAAKSGKGDICSNYHRGSQTSKLAHEHRRHLNKVDVATIVDLVRKYGRDGRIVDEVDYEINLGRSLETRSSTVCARCSEAKADGLLVETTQRRKTRRGNMAGVLVATEFATDLERARGRHRSPREDDPLPPAEAVIQDAVEELRRIYSEKPFKGSLLTVAQWLARLAEPVKKEE